MNNRLFLIISFLFTFSIFINGQTLEPKISFEENPKTHNMHICTDGKYYYTVNGGNASSGQINKFNKKGNLIDSYDLRLDTRSLFYRKQDKSLYVSTYEGNIYKIIDLDNGKFDLIHKETYVDGQSTLALGADGETLYEHVNGTIYVYDFNTGDLIKTIEAYRHASEWIDGANSIAVSKKKIYLFNGGSKLIYIYDLDGKFIKDVKISSGSYGASLSYANKLIFVSDDGDYSTGTWYGYKIK